MCANNESAHTTESLTLRTQCDFQISGRRTLRSRNEFVLAPSPLAGTPTAGQRTRWNRSFMDSSWCCIVVTRYGTKYVTTGFEPPRSDNHSADPWHERTQFGGTLRNGRCPALELSTTNEFGRGPSGLGPGRVSPCSAYITSTS